MVIETADSQDHHNIFKSLLHCSLFSLALTVVELFVETLKCDPSHESCLAVLSALCGTACITIQ